MKKILVIAVFMLAAFEALAQCPMKNTAVRNGEHISYNLYYNWKFIWVKAGKAYLKSEEKQYQGKKALRTSLVTGGNGKLDNFFVLRDTLLGYTTTDMVPLYYRKGAREGKRYTVDEAFYSYPDGKTKVNMHRQKNDGSHVWVTKQQEACVFDMVSIFQRARSFDPTNWKKGHEVKFYLNEGTAILPAKIKYSGEATVKADNGVKYNCLKLSYIEIEKGKEHEIARFYVTNDKRHIPVRIDMYLKIGSAKAYLTGIE